MPSPRLTLCSSLAPCHIRSSLSVDRGVRFSLPTPLHLWQTLSLAMQELPHGLPLTQCGGFLVSAEPPLRQVLIKSCERRRSCRSPACRSPSSETRSATGPIWAAEKDGRAYQVANFVLIPPSCWIRSSRAFSHRYDRNSCVSLSLPNCTASISVLGISTISGASNENANE
jgi:hypothetical protein